MGLFDIVLEKRENKNIIRLIVASGSERPYYIKRFGLSERGAFIRTGSATEPMPLKMIDRLFSKRTRKSIGKIKSPRLDLIFEQLKIYYNAAGKTLNEQFATNLELLNEDGIYNYVAYLMADNNSISVKVAKYSGKDRVDLIENNEYGFCSLITATRTVLDKVNLENKTGTKITATTRKDHRLWDEVALRETTINALMHNDYTYEQAPKFEFFADRFEITSYGGLPEGQNEKEFFEGFSIPKNKEIMRIFRDMELVEQLGSDIPRILESYRKECFRFSENYIRMTFPCAKEKKRNVTKDVPQNATEKRQKEIIKLIKDCDQITSSEIAKALNVSKRTILRGLDKLKDMGIIEYLGEPQNGKWEVGNNSF